jgi:protein-tyrosine phosphatase
VLVVCTGNVCRSPVIALLLARALSGTRIEVASAGTGPLPRGPVDPRIARLAGEIGHDRGHPMPRAVTRDLVAASDLVLTATRRQRGFVAALHPPALSYAFVLRDIADLAPDVTSPDPDLTDVRAPAPTWVTRVARALARERGAVPPRAEVDADIVDPYRRSDEVYDEMVRQVREALPPVVDLLRGSATRR